MSLSVQAHPNRSLAETARRICESRGGKWSGTRGMACCPAHDDRTPSLGVSLGRQAILFHCFAGCDQQSVLAALAREGFDAISLFSGSTTADLPEPASTRKPSAAALRIWHDAQPLRASPAKAYTSRLGLWGPETAFPTHEAFMTEIRAGGVAAMELVARDLKAQGLYLARALSFAGVEYEILEHCLTEAQVRIYDAYADAWAIIHRNLEAALEATRVVDEDSGDTLNRNAKAAALSIFEGTKQRFFAQLLLSMKLPSLIPAMEAALGEDHSVVVQLVSTAEAMLDRRLADLSDEEREALDIDLSPREYVIDYPPQCRAGPRYTWAQSGPQGRYATFFRGSKVGPRYRRVA